MSTPSRKGIQHVDGWRFCVPSKSREGIDHFVDLAAIHVDADDGYEFRNGECTCENFQFRLFPLLRRGFNQGKALRCRHIIEAMKFAIEQAILTDKFEAETQMQKSKRKMEYRRTERTHLDYGDMPRS